jgi:predicted HNH restriction endonuclease
MPSKKHSDIIHKKKVDGVWVEVTIDTSEMVAKPKLKKKKKPYSKPYGKGKTDSFYNSKEWRELRYRVIKKHGAMCMVCGRTPYEHDIIIHVDHIKPRSKFPALELDESNLQIMCEDCNVGKSNKDMIRWIDLWK